LPARPTAAERAAREAHYITGTAHPDPGWNGKQGQLKNKTFTLVGYGYVLGDASSVNSLSCNASGSYQRVGTPYSRAFLDRFLT
jgi:hypothetical protein